MRASNGVASSGTPSRYPIGWGRVSGAVGLSPIGGLLVVVVTVVVRADRQRPERVPVVPLVGVPARRAHTQPLGDIRMAAGAVVTDVVRCVLVVHALFPS